MDKLKKRLQEKIPEISLREFKFVEFDYDQLFRSLIPSYIQDIWGFRVWIKGDKYEIQENTVFYPNLTEDEVIKFIEKKYLEMKKEAEKIEKEKERVRMIMKMKRIKELKDEINSSCENEKTLDFLAELLNNN